MASNSFGTIFRITTFGESHGKGIGVVIDGCPAGIEISAQEIQKELDLRRPGKNRFLSPRNEPDIPEILSGIFEGKTTGAPLAIFIKNRDVDSSSYDLIEHVLRPGHANFTYLKKYGFFDYRGGGRASARETAARVAAGAVAKKFLAGFGIQAMAFISEIGGIIAQSPEIAFLKEKTLQSPIFCPDPIAEEKMIEKIEEMKREGDSIGGIVKCIGKIPSGLGDPIYQKLEATLAFAMLSIPASKGFEIGDGFQVSQMRGSEHNDLFDLDEKNEPYLKTNHCGGTLGGISTGSFLEFNVAFKPTSSILKPQESVTLANEKTHFQIPKTGRHDSCVAIRAVPVVESMCALVLADAVLKNRSAANEILENPCIE